MTIYKCPECGSTNIDQGSGDEQPTPDYDVIAALISALIVPTSVEEEQQQLTTLLNLQYLIQRIIVQKVIWNYTPAPSRKPSRRPHATAEE